MCLNTRFFSKKHTAKTDIIVYKYLIGNSENGRYFMTPYQFYGVELGCEYQSKLKRDLLFQVDVGLHSFVHLDDCISDSDNFYHHTNHDNIVIVKCVIPQGSRFYIGKYNEKHSIASDRLIYEKIIKK